MIYCTNCGNREPAGAKFCTSCGATIPVINSTINQPMSQPAVSLAQQTAIAPISETGATTTHREEPISTGGYFGIMFLLMIPLLNLLLLIIWACGGCRTINKRNLSRAILIWMLIGTTLSGLLFLVGGFFWSDQLNTLKELLETINY